LRERRKAFDARRCEFEARSFLVEEPHVPREVNKRLGLRCRTGRVIE
jgi:hypothetical protein